MLRLTYEVHCTYVRTTYDNRNFTYYKFEFHSLDKETLMMTTIPSLKQSDILYVIYKYLQSIDGFEQTSTSFQNDLVVRLIG
jgi:hypothetical protein